VTVGHAVQETVLEVVQSLGTVQTVNAMPITSRVGGQIRKVHFTEGQFVEKDALLFTIDSDPFQEQLNQAEAFRTRDLARLKFLTTEAKRLEQLKKTDVASQSDLDRALAEVAAMEATVLADEAEAKQARLNIAFCTIQSPVAGRTSAYGLNEGGIVEANKTQLLVVNQIKPIHVAFPVPERSLPEIQRRMKGRTLEVRASLPDAPDKPHVGKLVFVDNAIDTQSGMILLKAEFPNDDETLWPGQFVHATLVLGEKPDTVVVPEAAVQHGQKGAYVFVVNSEMAAEFRQITLGVTQDGGVEVLAGVKAGETVVTDGQNKLKKGFKVKVKGAGQEQATPPGEKKQESASGKAPPGN